MKLVNYFVVAMLTLNLNAFAFEVEESDTKRTFTAIPEMPFKRALIITTTLLYNEPQRNTEGAIDLAVKLSNYEILENKAEEVVRPLRESRRVLKQTIKNATFQDEQDLKNVFNQLKIDTNEDTAHNIEELQRDDLIHFNHDAQPVYKTKKYDSILEVAKIFQQNQMKLQKHPLYGKIEEARKELKPLMMKFLRQNYANVEVLQQAFNDPVQQVNDYLNALQKKQ